MPVCIVAGVGPGIGLAVARRFAREGFTVALLARSAARLAEYAREVGGGARAYAVDLSSPAAIQAAVARVSRELGDADTLVYNAAAWNEAHPMTLAPDAFAADLSLSVTGALVSAQAVYPAMKLRGSGVMLFTGGGLALRPEYGATVPALTAGKSALRGLVLAMAPVLARDGIHAATVTVAGVVARGTALDPDRIAESYWALHQQPRDVWQAERVLSG